jgi:hypothetical protein
MDEPEADATAALPDPEFREVLDADMVAVLCEPDADPVAEAPDADAAEPVLRYPRLEAGKRSVDW